MSVVRTMGPLVVPKGIGRSVAEELSGRTQPSSHRLLMGRTVSPGKRPRERILAKRTRSAANLRKCAQQEPGRCVQVQCGSAVVSRGEHQGEHRLGIMGGAEPADRAENP